MGALARFVVGLAEAFVAAPTAAVHSSTGLNMGRQGALAYYLVQMLALLTGNLDRPGGNVWLPRAVAAMGATASPDADSFEETPFGPVRRSKGSLPASLLPGWIGDEREPIRALFCVAGNPLLSVERQGSVRDVYTVHVPDQRVDFRVAAAIAVALDALMQR